MVKLPEVISRKAVQFSSANSRGDQGLGVAGAVGSDGVLDIINGGEALGAVDKVGDEAGVLDCGRGAAQVGVQQLGRLVGLGREVEGAVREQLEALVVRVHGHLARHGHRAGLVRAPKVQRAELEAVDARALVHARDDGEVRGHGAERGEVGKGFGCEALGGIRGVDGVLSMC